MQRAACSFSRWLPCWDFLAVSGLFRPSSSLGRVLPLLVVSLPVSRLTGISYGGSRPMALAGLILF